MKKRTKTIIAKEWLYFLKVFGILFILINIGLIIAESMGAYGLDSLLYIIYYPLSIYLICLFIRSIIWAKKTLKKDD